MNAEIKAVAARLKGLRDMLDISVETAANVCGISPKEYMGYESGEVDIPLSVMFCMGKKYNVDLTSFISGEEPHSVSLVYGVTKSAVHALVKNLVKFLVPYEVRVNAVAPGFVDTEWQKTKPAEIRQNIERKVSLGRFCEPSELAEVYKMLIENSYLNGEVIVVDGGYSYK